MSLWQRAYAQGGYGALFPKTPGRAKTNESAPDPRREAVIALKRANPEYGTRRIRDVLRRFEALPISETEVRRMLHEAKLLETSAAAPRPEPGPRRFERADPNQVWQSDLFTFLLRRYERVYVVWASPLSPSCPGFGALGTHRTVLTSSLAPTMPAAEHRTA
jgi:transposase InsO family protein